MSHQGGGGLVRGHCLARSVRGGLYIFGDVRMHALYVPVHVWNRVQKLCLIVFSLLFVRPRMYMRVRLLCVDVCVVLLLGCFVALLPCPDCERRCCAEIK